MIYLLWRHFIWRFYSWDSMIQVIQLDLENPSILNIAALHKSPRWWTRNSRSDIPQSAYSGDLHNQWTKDSLAQTTPRQHRDVTRTLGNTCWVITARACVFGTGPTSISTRTSLLHSFVCLSRQVISRSSRARVVSLSKDLRFVSEGYVAQGNQLQGSVWKLNSKVI